MPKVSPIQNNFNSGEVSPLFYGRADNDRYRAGVETCQRFLPTIQGGLVKTSGTRFVAEVETSTEKTRLVAFEYSTTDAYVLEFGDQYIRFYKNGAQIQVSSVAVTLTTAYRTADLFDLKFTQSASVLYIVHPDYPPRILQRFSDSNWVISDLVFTDGPYLDKQTTDEAWNGYVGPDGGGEDFVMSPSATSGTGITITANSPTLTITGAADNGAGKVRITVSAAMNDVSWVTNTKVRITGVTGTTEANGDWSMIRVSDTTFDIGADFTNTYSAGGTVYLRIFRTTDVGRLVRMDHSGTRGYAVITAVTDANTVTADVEQNFGGTGTTSDWYLGAWSDSSGYPSTVTFFEDRLCFAGAPETPQRVNLSFTSEYTNFATSNATGTVTDASAISATLNSNEVNAIRWLAPDEKGLLIGTTGGEWVVRSSSSYEAVTPTNISAKKSSSYGSGNIQPIQADKSVIYTQGAKRKIRELTYFYEVDGYASNDLTILSDHITGTGITEMEYSREPIPVVWAVREDGQLVGCTYERDLENIRAGWSRHIIGGVSDAAGSDAKVESIAVIPSSVDSSSQIWVIVQRHINGATKRYIEYFERVFDQTTNPEDAFFVDSGLTYDVPVDIGTITQANPGVVTATAHGFNNGDKVIFRNIKGMTELNNVTALVANALTNTFEITDLSGNNINTTGYSAYVSSGEVRKLVTTISGLGHLEGESVTILGDGATQPNQTVSSGSITLAQSAATVHIGLQFNADVKLLRVDAGAADGTSLGKTRRVHRIGLLLDRTLGLKYGFSFDDLDEYTFRKTSDPLNRPPTLTSGIISFAPDSDYDFENQVCLRSDQPLPMTLLAVMLQMVTQDRG